MPTDLDYAKVMQRLGLTAGDGADPDESPDTIWCDAGTVQIEPLNTYVKVADGSPVPWTGGNAVIECTVSDADYVDPTSSGFDGAGYLLYNGKPYVWVVDLSSDKVNPVIEAPNATHKVTYIGVTADGTPVSFPSVKVRITAAGDGISPDGINDLTRLSPVEAGTATPIYRGETGTGIASMAVNGLGELEVDLDNGTTLNAGELPVGPGGSDAGVAGYLATPASDSVAALDQANADLLDIPTSAFAIKTSASIDLAKKPTLWADYTVPGLLTTDPAQTGQAVFNRYGRQGSTASPVIVDGVGFTDTATQVDGGVATSGSYKQYLLGDGADLTGVRIGGTYTLGTAGAGGATTTLEVVAFVVFGGLIVNGGGTIPRSPCHLTVSMNQVELKVYDSAGTGTVIATWLLSTPVDGSSHTIEAIVDLTTHECRVTADGTTLTNATTAGGATADTAGSVITHSLIKADSGVNYYSTAETFENQVATDAKPTIYQHWCDTVLTVPSDRSPSRYEVAKAVTAAATAKNAQTWYAPTPRVTSADGNITSGSTAITSASAAFTAADVGKIITGGGIPSATYIAAVTDASNATLSQNATATTTTATWTIGAGLIVPASYAKFDSSLSVTANVSSLGNIIVDVEAMIWVTTAATILWSVTNGTTTFDGTYVADALAAGKYRIREKFRCLGMTPNSAQTFYPQHRLISGTAFLLNDNAGRPIKLNTQQIA